MNGIIMNLSFKNVIKCKNIIFYLFSHTLLKVSFKQKDIRKLKKSKTSKGILPEF